MSAPTTRMQDRDVIRTSTPGPQTVKRLRLPRTTRLSDDYVNATLGNKSGYATYGLTVGDATYRAVTWAIKSTAEIVGVTTVIAGQNYIKADLLSDYLDEVRIVANGSALQTLSMAELYARNAFNLIDYGAAYSGFAFPGTGFYLEKAMIDAYALGTKGFRSLSLELKLKAAFDENTMELVVMPHVVDIAKLPGFTYSTERLNNTFNGVGKHTYYDLPVGDDIKDIWIIGDGISHVRMEIDGDLLFDMDRAAYEAYLVEKGRDPSVISPGWFIDFHAEGDPRSLAALDRPGERRRDARVKMTLTTLLADTPVEFLVTHADLYARIR